MAPQPGSGLGASFQPAFDPSIQATFGPDGTTMTIDRGYIVQETGLPGGGRIGVRFLYNPSTLTVSYPSYEGEVALPSGIDPGAPGRLLGVTNQTLSFSIMFDRTLEVLKDSSHAGVNVDIEQMKALTGMTLANKFTSTRSEGGGEQSYAGSGSGVPMFVPLWFRFGTTPNSLRYYGSINSWTVQYSLWAYNMTPTRCEVAIEAALIPEGVTLSPSAGGGDSSGSSPSPSPSPSSQPTPSPQPNRAAELQDFMKWKYQQEGMR